MAELIVVESQSPHVRRSRPRTSLVGTAFVLSLLGALLLPPSTALAGTASVSSGTLLYVAAAGETNDVNIFLREDGMVVRELGSAPVVPGAGCTAQDSQIVVCGSPTVMDVDAGDGDDRVVSNDLGGTAHGGPGDDLLTAANHISGAFYGDAGDDRLFPTTTGTWTLSGGADDDFISGGCSGGCGNTLSVDGGDGIDTFSYSGRIEPVTVTLDDLANDGQGDHDDNIASTIENVDGGSGADTITGTSAANVLDGQGGGDVVTGAGGSDVLRSFGSANELDGGADNDRLISAGVAGADENTLIGGAGVDTADFSERSDGVVVTLDGVANDGAGHDDVRVDIEDVFGSEQADTLEGGAGPNRLEGRGGNDTLRGRDGADVLTGGDGTDTADYSDHATGVLVNPNGQPVSGDASDGPAGARDTIGADVENLAGGPADDRLVNSSSANRFAGAAGTDTVDYSAVTAALTVRLDDAANDGPAGQNDDVRGDVETVIAGSGADTLVGSGSANRLEGGDGADTLRGGAGRDVLLGGGGADTADYSERTIAVQVTANGSPTSGNGDDGAAGARDSVGSDVETLLGGAGGDILTGNALDNLLDGGGGNDALSGQGSDDVLRGAGGDDVMRGGAGADTADYANRTGDLEVDLDRQANDGESAELDNVGPEGDVERVVAGSGDDALFGNGAANRLDGGAGDDLVEGGTGPDVAIGGAGADVASYVSAPGPVTATINGTPTSGGTADGPVGARDTIGLDIEDLWGGPAGDRLSGNGGDNLLYGGDGADTLIGSGGDDAADYSDRSAGVRVALDGRPDSGNDADGPAGARDTLSTDLEVLFGGAGDDALDGNASENYLDAGAGNDVINSRDASGDADYCGDGNDTAFVDADDLSHATCETVYLPGQEPRPPAPVPPVARDTTRPTVAVRLAARQRLRSSLRKGLVLRTTCSERCQLQAQLLVDARAGQKLGLTKGRKRVVVARGRASADGRLVLRFTAKARKRLRKVKQIRLSLLIRAIDPAGNTATIRRRVLLASARAKVSGGSRPSALVASLEPGVRHSRLAARIAARRLTDSLVAGR